MWGRGGGGGGQGKRCEGGGGAKASGLRWGGGGEGKRCEGGGEGKRCEGGGGQGKQLWGGGGGEGKRCEVGPLTLLLPQAMELPPFCLSWQILRFVAPGFIRHLEGPAVHGWAGFQLGGGGGGVDRAPWLAPPPPLSKRAQLTGPQKPYRD